jgi:Domain of unknown function (DUF4349)
MTHPDSESTATIERDLRAVDAALHAGAANHDDPLVRELQELGLVLRADAAQPEAEFAEALEKRVEEGFPAAPGSTRALAEEVRSGLQTARAWPPNAVRNLPSPRRMLPAAGAVLTVVAVFVVVASVDFDAGDDGEGGGGGASLVQSEGDGGAQSGGGRGEAAPGGGGGPEALPPGGPPQAARSAAPAIEPLQSDDTQSSIAPPPGGRGGFAPGRSDRKVERTISMTLEAPNEEIPALAQDVTRVTNRHGGFVLSSTLDSDQEGANGFFELRIPAGRLRPALADLAGLATVREQSQSGQDVTRRHVTTRDRLQSARAERRSLLRRLELAATDEEAEAIRRRLDIVAGEINGLRALLRDLRLRTDYAVVTVDLAGTDDDSGGSGGAGASFDDAVGDAGDLVVGLAGVLIRVMAIAVPLGLIAALGWLATSALRRRRRESVLA